MRPPRVRHSTFPLIPTASTFVPSVQLLDFESRCPLIRHASLICGFCSLGQWFAIDFLQNLPHDKPLVFRLEVPAAGPSEVFHLLVLRHAGRTSRKSPGAERALRGFMNNLGNYLLSHMKICSIIGEKELNFRVRNGIGCTLLSMVTKKYANI